MASNILLKPELVSQSAGEIRNVNNQLDNTLKQALSAMKNIEQDYESDDGREIRSAMSNLQPTFEQYKEIVDAYAKHLDTVVTNFEQTQSTLKGNAEQYQQYSSSRLH